MKRIVKIIFILGAFPVSAGLLNGGFEKVGNGLPSHWSLEAWEPDVLRLTENGYRGGKALLAECVTGAEVVFSQKFKTVKGQNYFLSFRYRCSHLTPYMNVHVKTGEKQVETFRLSPRSRYWNFFVGSFKARSDSAELVVSLKKKGVRMHFDDFRLTTSFPRIPNGDFSLGLKYWRVGQGVKLVPNGISLDSGVASTLIKELIPGCDYRLSGEYTAPAPSIAKIKLEFLDAYGKKLAKVPDLGFVLKTTAGTMAIDKIIHVPLEAVEAKLSLLSNKGVVTFGKLFLEKIARGED
jgi:hypothetical protein